MWVLFAHSALFADEHGRSLLLMVKRRRRTETTLTKMRARCPAEEKVELAVRCVLRGA